MGIFWFFDKIKEIFKGMIAPKNIETVLHITPTISKEMINAIQLWDNMYKDKADWLHDATLLDPTQVKSLGLPAFIASEKARTALLEMNVEITPLQEEVEVDNPNYIPPQFDDIGRLVGGGMPKKIKQASTIGDTTRAEYIDKQFDKVRANIRRQLEYGVAKGGLVIKPYVVLKDKAVSESNADIKGKIEDKKIPHRIEFDYVQADGFYPIAFDGSNNITEACFLQRKVDKRFTYSRLEYHKLENNSCIVENRAFRAENDTAVPKNEFDTDLGHEIPLTEVPEWANLEKKTVIEDVDRLLFAYFRMPEANTIDPYSPLGVSCYSRAVGLIEQADRQYSRLLWEFEGGELAIDVDRDALRDRETEEGEYVTVNPTMQQRLFRRIDLNNEETYNVFNPQFRDNSIMNGLNNILMRIEDVTGLSRGTIADVSQEARTATELRILKQRSYASNLDVQTALEKALRDVIYIMDVYCTLYDIVPKGDFDVAFEWDDSILVDVESELGKRITLMQNGLASKLETRMWYFNETEAQAQIAMDKIREEAVEMMEQNMLASQDLSANLNNNDETTTEKPKDKETKDPDGKEFRKLSGPS